VREVSHEQLWAPWRLSYIVSAKDAGKKQSDGGCFLCLYRDAGEADDAANLVLLRGPASFAVLNRFPYNNGHVLIAPLAHKAALAELTDDELLDCMRLMQRMTAVYQNVLEPDGFNAGLNLGRVAGAGLPGHLHWHLVPRWNGDTNFMPVLADVNVISQSLEALYALVRNELGRSDAS
jgi:ATP adenylyltransferase